MLNHKNGNRKIVIKNASFRLDAFQSIAKHTTGGTGPMALFRACHHNLVKCGSVVLLDMGEVALAVSWERGEKVHGRV